MLASPPLIISYQEVDTMVRITREALDAVWSEMKP
jgi:putrescine aminotransferase